MATEPVRTVQAVLGRFESAFSDFTAAFNEGREIVVVYW
jgi:hypothetical protein